MSLASILGALFSSSGNCDDDDDDDIFSFLFGDDDDDDNDNNDDKYDDYGDEIPEGYVELYNGEIARLEDVDDYDDLADPVDLYR